MPIINTFAQNYTHNASNGKIASNVCARMSFHLISYRRALRLYLMDIATRAASIWRAFCIFSIHNNFNIDMNVHHQLGSQNRLDCLFVFLRFVLLGLLFYLSVALFLLLFSLFFSFSLRSPCSPLLFRSSN